MDCNYKPMALYVRNKKFNVHPGKISLSALVRSKEITREEAFKELEKPIAGNTEGINFCLKQLGLTSDDLDEILSSEPKGFHDYPSYYSIYKIFRLPIKLLSKMRLIPETIYDKYFGV